MNMNDLSFDPTDVRSRINPSLFEEPFRVDAGQLVGRIIFVDPRRVKPMPGQPRTSIEDADVVELASSIKVDGQKEAALGFPIVHPDFDVELEAGHRRTASCELNGCFLRFEVKPVPVNQEEQYDDAFIDNFNRRDLSLLDTVLSVEKLLKHKRSREDIARMAGKTLTWVDQYIILVNMDPSVRPIMEELNTGQRSEGGRKLRRKTALPLNIWVHIARMPKEEQKGFAEKLVQDECSIEDARARVRRDLMRRGFKPRQRLADFAQMLSSANEHLGRCLESCTGLKPSELQRAFGGNSARPDQAHWLAQSMRQTSVSLRAVADAIDPPPKPPGDPADEQGGLEDAFWQNREILLEPGRPSLIHRWLYLVQQGAVFVKQEE